MSYLSNDAGRMTQRTDPRGIVTTTSYDDLDRPLSVVYSDSTPSASYTYDQGTYGIGQLSSVSNSSASTGYTYDKMGRRLQQDKTIGGISFSMSWTYNVGGLATSYALPDGTTISQTFDNLGRPTSITSDWVDANLRLNTATEPFRRAATPAEACSRRCSTGRPQVSWLTGSSGPAKWTNLQDFLHDIEVNGVPGSLFTNQGDHPDDVAQIEAGVRFQEYMNDCVAARQR